LALAFSLQISLMAASNLRRLLAESELNSCHQEFISIQINQRRKFDAAMSEICRLKARANSGRRSFWLDRCFETQIRNIFSQQLFSY